MDNQALSATIGIPQWQGRASHDADQRGSTQARGTKIFPIGSHHCGLIIAGSCWSRIAITAPGLCSVECVCPWEGLFSLLAAHGQSPSVKDVYQGCQTVIIVRRISLEEGHAEGKTNMLAFQNIWRTLLRMQIHRI